MALTTSVQITYITSVSGLDPVTRTVPPKRLTTAPSTKAGRLGICLHIALFSLDGKVACGGLRSQGRAVFWYRPNCSGIKCVFTCHSPVCSSHFLLCVLQKVRCIGGFPPACAALGAAAIGQSSLSTRSVLLVALSSLSYSWRGAVINENPLGVALEGKLR